MPPFAVYCRITQKLMPKTGVLRYALTILAIAAVYTIAGKLGLQLAFVHASATAVWPPAGIALATFLILGYRMWPGILLGAFLVNITTEGSLVTTLGISVGNTLEGIVGAYLVQRFANGACAFDRVQDVLKFTFLAAMLSTTISATMGVLSLSLTGFAAWENFTDIWITWWLGDAVGDLIIAPFLLVWYRHPHSKWTLHQSIEALCLALSIIGAGGMIFGGALHGNTMNYPLEFLCIPPLIWAAFRFGQPEASAGIILLGSIAIWGTLGGHGPFADASENTALLLLQAFMGVAAVTTMTLAAAVSKQKETEEQLKEAHALLAQNFFTCDVSLQKLIDGVQEYAIFLLDPKGRVMSWNRGAENIKGYKASEIIGKDFSVFYMEEDLKEDKPSKLLGIAAIKGRVEDEGWHRRKDGSRFWGDSIISAIRNEKRELIGFAKVTRDMTDRRQAELERSTFINAASHELRTPLSAIRWDLELLGDDASLSTGQRTRLMHEALKQSQKMSEIIETLLTLLPRKGEFTIIPHSSENDHTASR